MSLKDVGITDYFFNSFTFPVTLYNTTPPLVVDFVTFFPCMDSPDLHFIFINIRTGTDKTNMNNSGGYYG